MTDRQATACAAPEGLGADVTFEQAREAYSKRSFWISFFVRPCCPPPAGDLAARAIEGQRELVRTRNDFTDEQKSQLIELIDEGEAWYRTTPYWSKGTQA